MSTGQQTNSNKTGTVLLTYQQAAARLRVHVNTIRNLVKAGLPVARPTPHLPRIREEDLDRFIDQRTV